MCGIFAQHSVLLGVGFTSQVSLANVVVDNSTHLTLDTGKHEPHQIFFFSTFQSALAMKDYIWRYFLNLENSSMIWNIQFIGFDSHTCTICTRQVVPMKVHSRFPWNTMVSMGEVELQFSLHILFLAPYGNAEAWSSHASRQVCEIAVLHAIWQWFMLNSCANSYQSHTQPNYNSFTLCWT